MNDISTLRKPSSRPFIPVGIIYQSLQRALCLHLRIPKHQRSSASHPPSGKETNTLIAGPERGQESATQSNPRNEEKPIRLLLAVFRG